MVDTLTMAERWCLIAPGSAGSCVHNSEVQVCFSNWGLACLKPGKCVWSDGKGRAGFQESQNKDEDHQSAGKFRCWATST